MTRSPKQRLTVTVDRELVDAAQRAVAAGRSSSVSSWVGRPRPQRAADVGSEVWRGRRNASLARALRSVDVRPLDSALGRAAGELLGAASRSDVIDAAVGLLSKDGDEIVTSDRDDLGVLAAAAGRDIELIRP